MTDSMEVFLKELAKLMRKHGVLIEGVESPDYYPVFDTIEIQQLQDEGIGRSFSAVEVGKYFDAEDLDWILKDGANK